MGKYGEILRALGRIEGRLIGLERLSERLTRLETWLAWLKGGWAVLAAAYVYVFKKL
jgi:hypothetical protein